MRLKEVRTEKQVSQYELADACGISQSSVAGYEKGRCTPNPDILLKMAQALGCSVDELLKDPKGEKSNE